MFGGEVENVFDLLGECALEGELEGVVISAHLIGLLLEPDNEDGKAFFGPHPEVEQVIFGLHNSVKDAKPT